MKRKKILCLFTILLVTLFLLVGCGGGNNGSPSIKPGVKPEDKPDSHVCQYDEWHEIESGDCYTRGIEERMCECGKSQQRETDFNHNYVTIEAQEATCDNNGYSEYQQCDNCGSNINYTEIPALRHSMGEWYVETEATCDVNGYERQDCENCDYCDYRTITAQGHDYIDVVTEPTETTQGYTTHTCKNCPSTVVDNYTPAILYFEEYKENELAVGVSLLANSNNLITITIPDEYNGKLVTKIDNWSFQELPNLKEVIIEYNPSNIKEFTIGESAFRYCSNLESITILPNCIIESTAFKDCSKLNVDDLAQAKSIGYEAFSGCSSLKAFDGLSFETRKVESIGSGAFRGCTSLESLYLPNDALSKHTLGYYFGTSNHMDHESYVPSSLKQLNLNTTREICDYAFYNCSSLNEIILNPYYGILVGEKVFDGCTGLEQIEYENGKYVKFTSSPDGWILIDVIDKTVSEFEIANSCYSIAAKAFEGCCNLTTVNDVISQYEQMTIGNNTFAGCDKLTSINLSTTVLIGKEAFKDCSSLYTISLGAITEIRDDAFLNCSNLISVKNNSNLNIQLGSETNGYVAYYAAEIITGTKEPNIDTTDGFITFTDSSNICYLLGYIGELTEITLPENINVIKAYSINNTITQLIVPETVTVIEENALRNAKSLETLVIPFVGTTPATSTNASSTSYFGIIFGRTHPVYAEFDIPQTLTFVEITGDSIIPDDAFKADWSKCSINHVVISGEVATMGWKVFNYCYGLTKLTLPYLGENVTSNGELSYSFYSIPETLKEVTILHGTKLSEYAFYHCTVESIILPSDMTTIGERSIYFSSTLKSITIPASIEKFERLFITECNSLENIYFKGTLEQWLQYNFSDAYCCPTYYAPNLFLLDNSGEWVKVTEIVIPSTINEIGGNKFYNLVLDKLTISSNVQTIKSYAFNSSTITTIIIPISVTVIENDAFESISGLTNVYYEGTEDQWNQIQIGYDNEKLTNLEINFNYSQN